MDCICILGISKKKTWDKEIRCLKCGKLEINNQQKKDKDDGSNDTLSGTTKQLKGQTKKDEHMPSSVDSHVDNPQDDPGKANVADNGDTDESIFPADSKSKKGYGRTYGY